MINSLFGGQLMNKLVCETCHCETLAFDNFLDLSLPLPMTQIVGEKGPEAITLE
jgi:ubiquitin C-terminal hydrolase